MKVQAIIELEVPDYQIGQRVSIYFPDTMKVEGTVISKSTYDTKNYYNMPEEADQK